MSKLEKMHRVPKQVWNGVLKLGLDILGEIQTVFLIQNAKWISDPNVFLCKNMFQIQNGFLIQMIFYANYVSDPKSIFDF